MIDIQSTLDKIKDLKEERGFVEPVYVTDWAWHTFMLGLTYLASNVYNGLKVF